MNAIKPIMTAGVIAALGLAPAAFAQSPATPAAAPSAQSAAPSAPSTAAQQPSSTTTASQQGTSNQEAARQALAAARQSLAELTKLPAAQQLQGEQRTAVANFISDFNAFATAQNDWRSKYQVVDESLNRLLGQESEAAPSSSTAATSSTPGATSGAVSGMDPTIIAKLQEVRTHLQQFEQNSGDPLFAVDAIQKQLDAAGAGASGVTLSAAQVEEIRKQLETIRQAAKK
jgi:pyruvate/2-oxoglutarate dehydrogenase complex dihydrolipoamide acyltransferase (E2) component